MKLLDADLETYIMVASNANYATPTIRKHRSCSDKTEKHRHDY